MPKLNRKVARKDAFLRCRVERALRKRIHAAAAQLAQRPSDFMRIALVRAALEVEAMPPLKKSAA